MKFEGTDADDRRMRQRVLEVMAGVDKAVQGRHVVEFTVTRTVNRKGERYPVSPMNHPWMTHRSYGDPMTRVTISFEVPDNVRPEFKSLIADITKIEAEGIRAVKEAKVAEARERAAQAQAEVDRLLQELDDDEVDA